MYSRKTEIFYSLLLCVSCVIFMSQFFLHADGYIVNPAETMMILSIVKLIQGARYKRDPEYADKVDSKNDERAEYISRKAQSVAFITGNILLYTAAFILHYMGHEEAAATCSYAAMTLIVIYLVTYLVMHYAD